MYTERERKISLEKEKIKAVAQKGAERRDGGTRQLSMPSFPSYSEPTHSLSLMCFCNTLCPPNMFQFSGLEWVSVIYNQRDLMYRDSQTFTDCWS